MAQLVGRWKLFPDVGDISVQLGYQVSCLGMLESTALLSRDGTLSGDGRRRGPSHPCRTSDTAWGWAYPQGWHSSSFSNKNNPLGAATLHNGAAAGTVSWAGLTAQSMGAV